MESFDKILLYVMSLLNLFFIGLSLWLGSKNADNIGFILDTMTKEQEEKLKRLIKAKS